MFFQTAIVIARYPLPTKNDKYTSDKKKIEKNKSFSWIFLLFYCSFFCFVLFFIFFLKFYYGYLCLFICIEGVHCNPNNNFREETLQQLKVLKKYYKLHGIKREYDRSEKCTQDPRPSSFNGSSPLEPKKSL